MKSPASILIVADGPSNRLIYRMALAPLGYAITEAVDGPTALSRLERSAARLVLLTLPLQPFTGLDTVRLLRAVSHDVPVVIITPHGGLLDPVAALKLGVIDSLVSPVTPDLLRQVVDEVIQRHHEPGTDVRAAHSPPTANRGGPIATVFAAAKRALNRREFDRAGELLERTLNLDGDRADAFNLKGLLHECRGRANAAYHAYKSALEADPRFAPALDNMRRYCERSGLNFHSRAINPAAGCPGRDLWLARARGHRREQRRAEHDRRSRCDGPSRHLGGLHAASGIPGGGVDPGPEFPSSRDYPLPSHRAGLATWSVGLLIRILAFPRRAGDPADHRRTS